MSENNPNWDIDFRDGKAGEQTVANILSVETVEVKTDRKWHVTGNIYIETEFYSRNAGEWVLSGLSTSTASHWAFVLEGMVVMLPRETLNSVVRSYGRPIACNIEPNQSRGFLIKVSDMMNYVGGINGQW